MRNPIDRADPFDPTWQGERLATHASRWRAGTPLEVVRDDLFEEIWPWAVRHAERLGRRVPPYGDADSVRSEVLGAVWQSCQRFEPDRWTTWPALLLRRTRGACIDAARRADPLSRRARRALRDAEQATPDDRGDTAAPIAPTVAVAPTFTVLDNLGPAEPADERWDPERAAHRVEVRAAIARWVCDDLPDHLAARVRRWLTHSGATRPMPARLVHELRPFAGRLVGLLADDAPAPSAPTAAAAEGAPRPALAAAPLTSQPAALAAGRAARRQLAHQGAGPT